MFDAKRIEYATSELIQALDYRVEGDLTKTPSRVAKAWQELVTPEDFDITEFDSNGYDEVVAVGPIIFCSICRHHLLPFYGVAWVSYLPADGRIVGLSKLPRTIQHFSKGLQTQEYITQAAAGFLMEKLKPKGVAVRMQAVHMCMEIRGTKAFGARTTTQCLLGEFRENSDLKQEFLSFCNTHGE